ncbi:MAG: DNA-3-methyladenine glycosylase 2 family protein [Chloroflexi bacterium]|nr:DNA-3-methyladenine glycosylase 2 family protein [Chloroflexota bacterium]
MATEIRPRGPFSLAASTAFLEGFTPAAYRAPGEAGHLHLAFALDGHDAVAAVCATQPGGPDEAVLIDMVVEGEAPDSAAGDQLARVLSLDIDGTGYPALGQRDRVVGRLQERYRGLRPVLFASPYEAAAWALIGARIAIRQAARVKERMAAELGTELTIHGDRVVAFPGPGRLRTIEAFPGLFGRKAEYLRGLAAATIEGRLDSANLRAMAEPDALAALRTITGVGPFSAELVLLRGVGTVDRAPANESRLGRAVALAYEREEPAASELQSITDEWRPFRTWVTVLVRTHLEETTHEIRGGGRRTPGDS